MIHVVAHVVAALMYALFAAQGLRGFGVGAAAVGGGSWAGQLPRASAVAELSASGASGEVGGASPQVDPVGRYALLVGLGTHVVALVAELATDRLPGFGDSLSAVGLGIMVAVAWTGRGQLAALGTVLAPLAALLTALAPVVPSPRISALELTGASLWLPIHLSLVFAAIAAFCLEFFVGLVGVEVRRRLKTKRLRGLQRLPSVEALDRMQLRALGFGLVALSFGVATGIAWAATTMHHGTWASSPKVWFTIGLWVWYAISYGLRLTVGFKGRWTLALSVLGFAGLAFSVIGLDFVTRGFHAYGG